MKKKLNLLCAMIFAVLLLSLSENIYSMVWGAIEGGKAGMENKAGEINNLHPLMLLPDNLISTSDSIYNEMTGKNVPIWHTIHGDCRHRCTRLVGPYQHPS